MALASTHSRSGWAARFALLTAVLPCLAGFGLTGCAGTSAPTLRPAGEALRVSTWAERGDARRRASTRLVLEGLDIGGWGREDQAMAHFGRAIQIDPSNPLAYLAMARQETFHGDPRRALEYLDKARATFGRSAEGMLATPHLRGLQGVSLLALGRTREAEPLLEQARAMARVWSDDRLDAAELR